MKVVCPACERLPDSADCVFVNVEAWDHRLRFQSVMTLAGLTLCVSGRRRATLGWGTMPARKARRLSAARSGWAARHRRTQRSSEWDHWPPASRHRSLATNSMIRGRDARIATPRVRTTVSVHGVPEGRSATNTATPKVTYSAAWIRAVTALNIAPSGFGLGGPVAAHARKAAEFSQRSPHPVLATNANHRVKRLLLLMPAQFLMSAQRCASAAGWAGADRASFARAVTGQTVCCMRWLGGTSFTESRCIAIPVRV